jgi:beta-galactosidase/beta-glucuronidase
MCKQTFFVLILSLLNLNLFAQKSQWKPVEGKVMTQWAVQVNPESPLPEYPRPQLVRDGSWQNLNGLWQYAITSKEQAIVPSVFDGEILVPYPIESALSGVAKTVGKDKVLWYKTKIEILSKLRNKKLLLHFGAIDWECVIFVNGKKVGEHAGGYDPFSFDISAYLNKGKNQEIVIRVFDPTDDGQQPVGKQTKNPKGIWYTSVTGIWQTVWMEAVPESYISNIIQTPDLDNQLLNVNVLFKNPRPGDIIQISAFENKKKIGEITIKGGVAAKLPILNPKLWSPESPFLYDLKVAVIRNGKPVDEITSYFAMRKISMGKDADGIQRIMLNNKFLFQYGTLDQGWWPDGLYTAPTDQALEFDIVKTKEMGFNMIRKHIKVEPARWYYHCDKLGMLVWQDMPSGDIFPYEWEQRLGQISGKPLDKQRSPLSEKYYKTEWEGIMEALHHFPSIVMWVPFNEAWGQFKTKEITEWTIEKDPSRLVNSASGGNYFPVGHVADLHNYPEPAMPNPVVFGGKQILALGEFGGLGLPVDGHTWFEKGNWGYQSFKTPQELLNRYLVLVSDLKTLIKQGLSAAVYTQITDVEIEVNGLMTYDRKFIKIPVEKLKEIHKVLYEQPTSVELRGEYNLY